ncbi:hypothetical protein MPTK1_3g11010 [Marchantia polymorpha subsp. ruderalis]|uniref:Uncharacterized protein n=2 Tax=Marchantia polymorpha TaxID=3197 RepID=A0AAF6AZJ9_MARPO|nr:hypothetical protein MARPO_0037s0095 [Marchantia polymorpha]BBN05183.1 hypothetical protein Mp_3g11010 [Marchantia polymorpha subsp. ruderalis]|eukprot:PTQ40921.1 hypothetical protein MARPO_0037s0095 [Marchantia polymorpha]
MSARYNVSTLDLTFSDGTHIRTRVLRSGRVSSDIECRDRNYAVVVNFSGDSTGEKSCGLDRSQPLRTFWTRDSLRSAIISLAILRRYLPD